MKRVSPWISLDGYSAMRVIEGTDPYNIANRVAFIEKSPRVRVQPFVELRDDKGWQYGPKGVGGSTSCDCGNENCPNARPAEEQGIYGFDADSRNWCDAQLINLGYDVPDANMTAIALLDKDD